MKKEIIDQEIIQYIGLNDLDPVDQEMVKKLVDEYSYKVKRVLHNVTSLVLHIKRHSKGGNRDRIEISLRALAPTRIFEVGKTEDWDLARAVHKAFKDILREIEHEYKQN
ncbi:hypothetical protein ACFL96_07655 [Thermoproteota archaeon]